MNSKYLTKDEFEKYLAELTETIKAHTEIFKDVTESIKALSNAINEQEEYLLLHNELFEQYEQRSIYRFLDWIGSGDPLDPVNIGVSISYDKFNRRPSHKPTGKHGSGCLTSIIVSISISLLVGLVIVVV